MGVPLFLGKNGVESVAFGLYLKGKCYSGVPGKAALQ